MNSFARAALLAFVPALVVSAIISNGAAAKPVVPVTNCYNLVQDAIGELTANLNCSTFGPTIVSLERATLRLNGFTITGISTPTVGMTAGVVHCRSKCRIEGPGAIVGGEAAVTGSYARVIVENVTMRDALKVGANVYGESRARFTNVTIESSAGCAYIGEDLLLRESLVTGNQCGVYSSGTLRVVDSEVSDNTGSPDSHYGVFAGKPRISGSTLFGNSPDVRSNEKPGFRNSTCETSLNQNSNGPWGFCSLD